MTTALLHETGRLFFLYCHCEAPEYGVPGLWQSHKFIHIFRCFAGLPSFLTISTGIAIHSLTKKDG